MKGRNEHEWVKGLMKDLEKLDHVHDAKEPKHEQIMNTLNEFKRQRQKAWKRELTAFICTALAIWSFYFVIAFKMPAFFLWIQAAAIIIIPVIYAAEKKRRGKANEVLDNG